MQASPMIDTRTSDFVRSAMAAAQAGRLKEACAIGERGLAEGGDPTTLRALLGALLCGAGDYAAAIPHLREAHQARPADPLIARNLATALTACEHYEEVRGLLSDALVASDATGALLRLRGFAAQMSEDLPAAIADFEQVVARWPDDWETWNNLGNVRATAGDLPGAVAALGRASAINPQAAPTRLNLARAHRDSGELAEAEAVLRAMIADFPADPYPLIDLYHVLHAVGRDEAEAEEVLEKAVALDPNNVDAWLELGGQQIRNLGFDRAERSYRSVLDLDPNSGKAFFGLARVFEHLRPGDLAALKAEAEAADIDSDRLNLIRAFAARRARDHRSGLDALTQIPADLESATRWQLAGQMHDALEEYDLAFDAFTRMNEAHAGDESRPLERAAQLRDLIRGEIAQMTPEWKRSWTAPAMTADRAAPVFLAGFPRSGTTLLDTMLMGHPGTVVLEEQPTLRKLELEFGGFDALAAYDEQRVRDAQKRYFELSAEHADLPAGALIIDKSPLYLQRLAQIYRLFPEARFIVAIRHPADVVLSCFMANFRLNSSMSNFLQLATAAEFYDLTFTMWERALALFQVEVHTVVYESLIDDPEGVLRPLVASLGLEWRPEVVDHQRTAKERGIVATASYAQVTEPLYRRAAGRWRHYRKHLEPVLPVLAPWAEKFGYEL